MILKLYNRKRMSVFEVILPFLSILLLMRAVDTACVFGDMNPPPSSQQYVNNYYYLQSSTLNIPIGAFTGNACSGVFSYRISNIKDVSGAVQVLASFPITLSTSGSTSSLDVVSSDSSLVALSPFTVEIEASCSGSSCLQYQYILVTFMDPNPCSAATISLNPINNGVQAQQFSVTTGGTITLNTYTYNAATYPYCYTFTYYEVDQVTTLIVPPVPLTIAYPTVTIPTISAGAIGQVSTKVYTLKIKATVTAQPSLILWSTFELTLKHECSLATFVGSPISLYILTYTIASSANKEESASLHPFQLSNSDCSITYSIVDQSYNALPSYFPFHFDNPVTKIFTGETTNPALEGIYNIFVKAQVTFGTAVQYQEFKMTLNLDNHLKNNCNNAKLSLTNQGLHTASIILGGPAYNFNFNIFTYDSSNFPNCYGFTGYEIDQITLYKPPVPITLSFVGQTQNIQIPQYLGNGAIGSSATSVYKIKVKAKVIGEPTFVWGTIEITFQNECNSAIFTNSATRSIIQTYNVIPAPSSPSPQISVNIGPFTLSNPACSIVYSLVDGTTGQALSPALPVSLKGTQLLIGTCQNSAVVSANPYTVKIKATIQYTSIVNYQDSTLTFTGQMQHECQASQITYQGIPFLYNYKIKDPTTILSLYQLHTYQELASNLNCFAYELFDQFGNPTILPTYISYSNQIMTFGPTQGGEIGQSQFLQFQFVYKATNTHTLVSYFRNMTITIMHECMNTILTPPVDQNFTYYLGSVNATFKIPKFSPVGCSTEDIITFDNQTLIIGHPVFKYDHITRVLTVIRTDNSFYLGQHSFIFQGANLMNTSILAKLNVGVKIIRPIVQSKVQIKENLGGPFFKTAFPSIVPVSLGTPYLLKLPQLEDPDPQDRPSLSIDWGFAYDFIKGQYPSFQIYPPVNSLSLGSYVATVTITDNHFPTPITSIQTFTLKITDPYGTLIKKADPQKNTAVVVQQSSRDIKQIAKQQKEKGTAFIRSIDHFGKVTVQFNQPANVPDSTTTLKDRVIKLRISPGNIYTEKDEQLGIKNWTILGKIFKSFQSKQILQKRK